MTKEALEKEAITIYKTGSYPQLHPDHYAFIHGYLASAEPREKRIEELDKENAELKNRDCWKSCEYANPKAELIGQHIKDVQNLTRAKEIIKELLDFDFLPEVEIKRQAEQFIDEIE